MSVSPINALATPIEVWGRERAPLREHLLALLQKVWEEGEGFSGKRPFGNSFWEHELETALYNAGLLKGQMDNWGDIDYEDRDFDFGAFISECIRAI